MNSRRRALSDGQSLVEFALIFPIFLLILLGAFDVGRAVWFQNQVEQLADQAARQAAVSTPGGTCTGLTKSACVDAIVAGQRIATDATAKSECRNADGSSAGSLNTCPLGKVAYVRVSASWSAITPLVGYLIGPRTFSSQATLHIE